MEVVDRGEQVVHRTTERAGDVCLDVTRTVHGYRTGRPVGVVAASVGVGDQVEVVVTVQVAEDDGVDVEQTARALQRTCGAVARVDAQAEPSMLETAGR